MNRRELLKLGGTFGAISGLAAPQANQKAEDLAPPKGRVFDDHQLATVAALAAQIIPRSDTPGADEAGVHVYLDRLLAEGPLPQRVSFLQGLSWLDGYCLHAYEQPFMKLSHARQIEVLTVLNGAPDVDLSIGQAFFVEIKRWITQIYYATEPGQTELNKGGRVPATYHCMPT